MRQIINFNSKWAFTKMADSVPATMPEKWDFVNVPHCWNAIDGQDGDNDYYRGTCYYAKQLKKIDLPEADRYYIEFKGTNSSATLYVNGKELAVHHGGYSTWRVDITDELVEENLVVVAVDNSANETVYPQMADFTFYGGMYRDVNIIAVNNAHFDLDYYGGPGVMVTPAIDGANANVNAKAFANCDGDVQFVIKNADGDVIATATANGKEASAEMVIENVHLWNGRPDPYL